MVEWGRMEDCKVILEVRSLAEVEVAMMEAAIRSTIRTAEDYFRRYREPGMKITLPRVRWLEGDE